MSRDAHRRWPMLEYRVGALPFRIRDDRDIDVLLVRRREGGAWSIPKGHVMAGLEEHETAAQEALEEAGATGAILAEPIGRYLHPKSGPTLFATPRIVEVAVFPLRVDDLLGDWPETGWRERRWFSRAGSSNALAPGLLQRIVRQFEVPAALAAAPAQPRLAVAVEG